MNVPKKIIAQAKKKALAHIDAVKTMIETDGDWDDCQADPCDAWLTGENYDLNVVGDNEWTFLDSQHLDTFDKEGDPIRWSVALYTGKTNAKGFWETDSANYVTIEL